MGTVWGMNAVAFWIVVTGSLVAACGALLGNYLVLRRMSLLGDAVSHAILPGLALAFLVTQSRSPGAMFVGAILAGLATVALTGAIRRFAGVPEDAAMGVVFTSLFALGVVIITRAAGDVDLDPGCVLYGILESAALDTQSVLGLEAPRVTITMAVMTALTVAFVVTLWKELKIVSFDPDLATTLGIDARWVHGLLMLMTAAYCVAAFEAVGSILVVAMLIVPPAAAYLLTDRLSVMVALSVVIAVSSAVTGRFAGAAAETSAAGMMAVTAGVHFAAAVIFSPRYGWLVRRVARWATGVKIVREDLLLMRFRVEEKLPGRSLAAEEALKAMRGGWMPRLALWTAFRMGQLRIDPAGLQLTEAGRAVASGLVRGHRLWEAYLEKHFDLPADHLHDSADRIEHFLDDGMRERIADALGQPRVDPHGSPIGGDAAPPSKR